MTSLSPPTDDELRRISKHARYNVSVGFMADSEGFVATVCDALLQERAAHSATKAALAFYADEDNAHREPAWPNDVGASPRLSRVQQDNGNRARAALAALSPSPTPQNVNENG